MQILYWFCFVPDSGVYSQPETGMDVTEMIYYDWLMVIVYFDISCNLFI